METLDALAQWLERHKLPVETFRRERGNIRSDPRSGENPIAARLRLAAALHRGGLARSSESATARPGLVEPLSQGVARPWIRPAAVAVVGLGLIAGGIALAWQFGAPASATNTRTSKDEHPPPPAPTPPPEPESALTANFGERSEPLQLHLHRGQHEHISIDLVVCDPNEHKCLTSKLYVATTETTRAQYKFVMNTFPPDVENAEGPEFPATNVTYKDAVTFCQRIQTALGFDAEVRLLFEAEWRCLAGPPPPEALKSISVYNQNEAKAPAQVKTKQAAYPAGIYDLWGNVREWLWSSGHTELDKSKYIKHLAIGGSRQDSAEDLEKPHKYYGDDRDDFVGFRIVVIPAQQ